MSNPKRVMVPEYRLQLVEDAVTRLTDELKRLRAEQTTIIRKHADQSDEAKRERAMERARKYRARRRANVKRGTS